MTANRNYSSVARLAALTAPVTDSSVSITVDVVIGAPTPPFTIVLDPGRAAEEICTCTALVGLSMVILRGQDGSAAQPHEAGAQVRHMATARDYREPAEHIGVSSGVHGVSGFVVGTSDTQSLDNKTFSATGTDHVPLHIVAAQSQTTNLLEVRSSSNVLLSAISAAGKFIGTGSDTTGASSFTAGTSSTVALIAKAALSQTASVFSVRDSTNAEVIGFSAAGVITAAGAVLAALAAGNIPLVVKGFTSQTANLAEYRDVSNTVLASINAVGRLATPGIDSSDTSTFTTAVLARTPVIVTSPTASTVPALSVKDQATATNQAGVAGANNGYRLFHGGDTTHFLPLRIHAGTVNGTIQSGDVSTVVVVNLTTFGFTLAPIVTTGLVCTSVDGTARRAAVHIAAVSPTSLTMRIIQTEDIGLGTDTVYTINWIAVQATTGSSTG